MRKLIRKLAVLVVALVSIWYMIWGRGIGINTAQNIVTSAVMLTAFILGLALIILIDRKEKSRRSGKGQGRRWGHYQDQQHGQGQKGANPKSYNNYVNSYGSGYGGDGNGIPGTVPAPNPLYPNYPARPTPPSPIENKFYFEWTSQLLPHQWELLRLYPEFPINGGQFRIDFAHPATLTAIELDGYAYHHTAEQLTRDYQRQHYLESLGWHFIRFTGKQIHRDCAGCVTIVKTHILSRLAASQSFPMTLDEVYPASAMPSSGPYPFPNTVTGVGWPGLEENTASQSPTQTSEGSKRRWPQV